jgi:predicted dehydrogenase
MPDAHLSWGFLSTARINRALIWPISHSKHSCLAGVASRSLEKAEAYAQEWGFPRIFGSYEELLASPEIDVVYIALPNSMHAEWTIKAVQAGKHVLCEKPLAVSVAEVDAVTAAARTGNRVVAEAFMYRHHSQTLKVKELIQAGLIGRLQLIRGAFTYYLNRPADIRLNPSLSGGALWDVGCYPVSYARTIVGAEPLSVSGRQVVGASGVDVIFTADLLFPGPVFAQLYCSLQTPYSVAMEFIGEEGTLAVPQPFKPEKRTHLLLTKDGRTEKIPVRGGELYSGEVEDMENAALSNKQPLISLQDSRNNIAVLCALFASAQSGQPVDL